MAATRIVVDVVEYGFVKDEGGRMKDEFGMRADRYPGAYHRQVVAQLPGKTPNVSMSMRGAARG